MSNFAIDKSQLKDLQKKLSAVADESKLLESFFEDCAKALAARLLERVIKRTPVEENRSYVTKENYTRAKIYKANGKVGYKNYGGKLVTKHIKGGALRRGWTAGGSGADAWARSANVVRKGNTYEVTVSNPVEYAPFVEYGHRQKPGRYVPALGKRLKSAWVPGKFMLTLSTQEVEKLTPALMTKMINEFLSKVFK